ncbi:2-hydroxyacid dehydrogenase [Polycladidibacter hongkongensis]|uniref:2-hydroxyacid dehydrogenase n=1 Tax=Polycladidibacter hongkongensis TaxID=1647556 RepID=UPI0008306C8E|nr:glyoxylate/hydroxypyruvate reductase A [Pseudovibrio hongkongensis]
MSIIVSASNGLADAWAQRMQSRFPDTDANVFGDANVDYEACRFLLAWKPDPDVFTACKNLEVIFSLGAGVDHLLDVEGLPNLPIVRIVDEDLTTRMTEWVVLQVLLHQRQQLHYLRAQAGNQWLPRSHPAARHLRVGIMGLGELGSASAKALCALGFQVHGWSRSRKRGLLSTEYVGPDQLQPFLSQTDVLVNLLPLTQQTRHLVDTQVLGALAQDGALGGPIYINAGRGGTQVEADVAAALQSGQLVGASIDVFEQEPLPQTSPLWSAPNLIMTPHTAAESNPEALSDYIANQISAYRQGLPLKNLVDSQASY